MAAEARPEYSYIVRKKGSLKSRLVRATSVCFAVGKGVVYVVGLAVVLALTIGIASEALAGNGDPFRLGRSNTASNVTKLIKSGVGPALDISVDRGPPLKVDSDELVTDLNADEVDGRSFECPAGMIFHEAACIEATARGPASYHPASSDCRDEGRRLPTPAELQTFRTRSGHDFTGSYELPVEEDMTDSSFNAVIVEPSSGQHNLTPVGSIWKYRCVASPT